MRPLFLAVLTACTPHDPVRWVVVCGPSGLDPCTKTTILQAGAGWSDLAVHAPGSELTIIIVGGSYSDTRVVGPFEPPMAWEGNVANTKLRFRRGLEEELAAIDIRSDDEVGRRVVRSDDLSALAIADGIGDRTAQGAKPLLILASDGLVVGSGFNVERNGFPTVDQALAKLGSGWTLDGFSEARICGFGNEGVDRELAETRARFFEGLFRASGGPTPSITQSCAAMFDPVPDDLMPIGTADPLGAR